jgi:transposase-like protein
MSKRRNFSIEEKLEFLQEVEEVGITETCHRHDLSHSVVNRWRRKFESDGVDGLKPIQLSLEIFYSAICHFTVFLSLQYGFISLLAGF